MDGALGGELVDTLSRRTDVSVIAETVANCESNGIDGTSPVA